MKRVLWVVLAVLITVVSCSKKEHVASSPALSGDKAVVYNFFLLRQAGDTDSAWYMLSNKSRQLYSADQFKQYCFVYKVIDFSVGEQKDGFYPVSYTYYNKRMDKKGHLHNFYITKETEYLSVKNGSIVFPHTLFVSLRNAIEQQDIDKARSIVRQMLELSPRQPEVLESAEKMGLL